MGIYRRGLLTGQGPTRAVLALVLLAISLTGCRSKLKVKGVTTVASSPSPGIQPPVEKPGESRAIREITYAGTDLVVQTATASRLRISEEVFANASELILKDTADESQLSLDMGRINQSCGGAYCLVFPSRTLNADQSGMFLKYGDNNLKLLGITPTEDLTSNLKIQLRDWQVFGLMLMRPVDATTSQPAAAPAAPGTLQSISLLTVAVPAQSGDPAPNPLDPVMISNWQEAVQR